MRENVIIPSDDHHCNEYYGTNYCQTKNFPQTERVKQQHDNCEAGVKDAFAPTLLVKINEMWWLDLTGENTHR